MLLKGLLQGSAGAVIRNHAHTLLMKQGDLATAVIAEGNISQPYSEGFCTSALKLQRS